MSELIVVSNRGPLSFRMDPDGALAAVPAGGGLVSALAPLLARGGTTWASVTMGAADRAAVAQGRMVDERCELLPIVVDDDTYREAYDVVANTTLWYCHHHLFDLPRRPRFDRHWRQAWEGFRRYNQAAADVVCGAADDGATVLVQDYHFSLLGQMLRDRRPDLATAHFSHVPFADPNMLHVLPDEPADELLAGLAGFGACGFHAHKWEAGFLACYAGSGLAAPRTFVSPLAPDHEGLATEAAGPSCTEAAAALRSLVGERQMIVRVDRVEPSKNIVRGMLAFEELLLAHPEWRDRVVHLALAYPSRQGLAEYLAYGAEVAHTAERINHALGTPGWTPIVLQIEDDRARSLAALTLYDVLLVNPVRDGLNLVAKEGPLLNTSDGALVLSREAGSWEELGNAGAGDGTGKAALGINPFDVTGTAEALLRALEMSPAERAARAARLRSLVLARTAADWMRDQLAAARRPAAS